MATGLAAVLTIAVGIIIVLFIYIRRQKKRSSEDHETTRRVLHETRLELDITNRQLAKYLTKFPKKVNEMTTIENFINETQNRKMKISSNQDTFGLNDLSLTPPPKSPPSPPPITESTESSSAIKTILSEQNMFLIIGLLRYFTKIRPLLLLSLIFTNIDFNANWVQSQVNCYCFILSLYSFTI